MFVCPIWHKQDANDYYGLLPGFWRRSVVRPLHMFGVKLPQGIQGAMQIFNVFSNLWKLCDNTPIISMCYTDIKMILEDKSSLVQKGWYGISVRNSNLAKSRSSITYVSIVQSIWNFAQSTAVILPCSAQDIKLIGQLKHELWANEISRDLSLRWISDGHPILHKAPEDYHSMCDIWSVISFSYPWHCSKEEVCFSDKNLMET